MGTIDVINYFLGGLFILLGFLTSINPNLIAGYNTMSKDEKDSFDIDGFKHLLRKVLISGGLFFIIGNLICLLLSWNDAKIFVSFLPGLVLPPLLVYKSKSYSRKKNTKSNLFYLVIAFSFLFLMIMGVFFFYAPKEPNILISTNKFEISGLYGFDISINDIKSIEITDSLPKILLRTNGLGLGSIRKGYFKLEKHGICKLFLQKYHSPYLKIIYSDDKLVYLNFKDKGKTIKIYNELLNIKNPNKIEK